MKQYAKNFEQKIIFVGVLKVTEKDQNPEPDPDPLMRGTDPRIRSRILSKCHGSETLAL
jgi:hypothetical protein